MKDKDLKKLIKNTVLASCGGCVHCSFWEQYCEKHNKSVKGYDPACEDYKSFEPTYGK